MAHSNFEEKTFAGGSKTAKFMNVFSLESFPLYGTATNPITELTAEVHASTRPVWSVIVQTVLLYVALM